jgi:CBS domain-containing protein
LLLKLVTKDRDIISAVMTRSVYTLTSDRKTIDALNAMVKRDIGSVPVLDKGKLVGIITERDIVKEITKSFDYLERKLSDTASRDVIVVSPDTPLWEAFAILLRNKIRRLPVVQNGKLVGIVTERDLFKWVVRVAFEPNIPKDLIKLIGK